MTRSFDSDDASESEAVPSDRATGSFDPSRARATTEERASVTIALPRPPSPAPTDGEPTEGVVYDPEANTVAAVRPPVRDRGVVITRKPVEPDSVTSQIVRPSRRVREAHDANAEPRARSPQPPSRTPAARAVPQASGTYRLSDPIGSGGMATVHLAVRTDDPTRLYAIKRLQPLFVRDEYFTQMLLDEAAITARIRHANVVTMHGASMVGSDLILVMDYSPGVSLAELIRSVHPETIPPRFVAAIMAGALRGLHAAHEAVDDDGRSLEIIHRDVSPQNVHVGIDGVGRVLDFGIAKAAHRMQSTRVGELKGKIAYMAPEQLHSQALDRRVDVRSSAVVLWEVLTASPLFHGSNDAESMTRVLEGCSTPPSEVAGDIPAALDDVVMRGLATRAQDRFPTALEMADALDDVFRFDPASPQEIARWVNTVAAVALRKQWDLRSKLLGKPASMKSALEAEVTVVLPPPAASPRSPVADAPAEPLAPSVPAWGPPAGSERHPGTASDRHVGFSSERHPLGSERHLLGPEDHPRAVVVPTARRRADMATWRHDPAPARSRARIVVETLALVAAVVVITAVVAIAVRTLLSQGPS